MNAWLLPVRLARRELRGGLRGFRIFLACLALGVAAIAGVGSLAAAVEAGIRADARALLGGDVEVRTVATPLDGPERRHLQAEAGEVSEVALLGAMAYAEETDRRVVVALKAVDRAYPLYGEPRLEPPGALDAALADGGAAVDAALLGRLGLDLGDRLRLGDAFFEIRAVLRSEPDRVSGRFSLGPRVLIGLDALPGTGLAQPGSLVRYAYRVRLTEGVEPAHWIGRLEEAFPDARWQAREPANAQPGLRRFVERMGSFLTLAGLASLLVGGIGVAVATHSNLAGKTGTIATLKSLGAPASLIFRTYLLQTLALAGVGILAGLAVGAALPLLLDWFFAERLPLSLRPGLYLGPLALAAAFGLLTAFGFALWPLAQAREVPPARLFRALVQPPRRLPRPTHLVILLLTGAALAALAVYGAPDRRLAHWFLAGAGGAVVALLVGAWAVRRAAGWLRGRGGLALRMALADLQRPGSTVAGVIVALGAGLSVLITAGLVEANLTRQLETRVPRDAPSFFFIDIQPDQLDAFRDAIRSFPDAAGLVTVPMLRGRIVRVNGVPVDEAPVDPGEAWVTRRDIGFTYAGPMPAGAELVAGEWWPEDYAGPPLISLDVDTARGFGLKVGDTMSFNILGRVIEARIANTRVVEWSDLGINFVVVFAPGTLEAAQQTYIGTVKVSPEGEPALLDALAREFHNVTPIAVREMAAAVGELLGKIALAIRGVGALTLASGLLVLAGAVAAGRQRRLYEAVVLKVLGATRRDLLTVFALEYAVLGFAAALVAAVVGTVASYLIVTNLFDSDWVFAPGAVLSASLLAVGASLLFGFAATWRALGQKAAPLLREA